MTSLSPRVDCRTVTSYIPSALCAATQEREERAERWLRDTAPLRARYGSPYSMGESFFLGFSGSTGLGGLGKGMLPGVLLLGEDRTFIRSKGKGKTTVEGFSVDRD